MPRSRAMVTALYDASVDVVYAAISGVGNEGVLYLSRFGPLTLAFLGVQLHPEQ